ncbi:MAG TPA: response regulator [Candidatus Eisenbacteria bacterium]|nr:response regulator [Candidatus Eisenbacteria bacterium]
MKPNAEVRVLIVEDDPFYQRVLQKRISNEGYQVMTAADGRQGMKAIVSFEPDLVVSDWMMPEVDGLELCQSVKTGLREAAPYFILLTAKGEISDKLLGLQTGADDYLTKPCDQGELMARVRAGVRIISLTQDLRCAVTDLKVAVIELERAQINAPAEVSVCDSCRRLSSGGGPWQEIGEFVVSRAEVGTPASLCPECDALRRALLPPPDAAAA